MPAVNSESATVEQHWTCEANMQGIQDYIESRLDILKNKFLVFVCNINNIHWVSVVAVNPFLISDAYLAGGKNKSYVSMAEQKKDTSEDFVGFCVLNSTQRPAERKARGFQVTYHTKYDAAYGVRLFLNICASYLKAKRKQQGTIELEYEEPFGEWQESMGCEGFRWFDFYCPSIVSQPNSHDCGLAVVANITVLIKRLKEVPFMGRNLTRRIGVEYEMRYALDVNIYSLEPFWTNLMKDARRCHTVLLDSGDLLKHMRKEFIGIVDETAKESEKDQGHYEEVQRRLVKRNKPHDKKSHSFIQCGQ